MRFRVFGFVVETGLRFESQDARFHTTRWIHAKSYKTSSSANSSKSITLNLPRCPTPSPISRTIASARDSSAIQFELVPEGKATISTSHPLSSARRTQPRNPLGAYSDDAASPVASTITGREGSVGEGEKSSSVSRIFMWISSSTPCSTDVSVRIPESQRESVNDWLTCSLY